MLSKRARPGLTLKKSEERGRSRSVGRDSDDGPKEPASAGVKSTREENAASFFGDIVISQKKGADDPSKKSNWEDHIEINLSRYKKRNFEFKTSDDQFDI